ncbi:YbaK/EbsC family protein [Anaerosphaera multitolerans]|uniref:YbaK/EbsC family protein n=1 Tax=Anaerosphaera multitolerans TaxID=2487351 RepID=A0A437S6K1_9FIRM|nr:YbaK/EbsC family protein [Anaerosphaera multitolerans]RVU54643.1 YbaK/EbsC family protein [Anaerosphaera multitolerans]
MSFEKVVEHLREKGLEDRISEFDVSSATVSLAAEAVGCRSNQIAKTLSFKDREGNPFLIVVSGDAKINNRKFKDEFAYKAKMLSAEEVVNLVGHAVGGVCPFAIKDGCRVYLDESLKAEEIIYPAAGSANSAVKLTIEDLEKASDFERWVNVTQ